MGVRIRETAGFVPAAAGRENRKRRNAMARKNSRSIRDTLAARTTRRVLPCSDEQGRDRELTLAFTGRRLVLTTPDGTAAVLTPLQSERLRSAVRDLLLDVDPSDYA